MTKRTKNRTVLLAGLLALLVVERPGWGQIEAVGSYSAVTLDAEFSPELRLNYAGTSSGLDFFNGFFGSGEPTQLWTFSRLSHLLLQSSFGSTAPVEILAAELHLSSWGNIQRYVADENDDSTQAFHIWHEDSSAAGDRLMQLEHDDQGDLLIGGQLSVDQFDLAERFWESEPVEPGELVAIDPGRSNAVRPTTAAYQPTVLGVASTRPGLVLGRRSFTVEGLQRTWGSAVAQEFERQRPSLELQALAESPELAARAESVRSRSAFESLGGRSESAEAAVFDAAGRRRAEAVPRSSSEQSLEAGYQSAVETYEMLLFDAAAKRFFDRHYTAVALAGRVPVKADASFGAIRPGDPLTSSPLPGVAMLASKPGPIVGTALESLESGAGVIEVFVHRGWFGGGARDVAAAISEPPELDAKDLRIRQLETRLAALERRLDRLDLEASPRLADLASTSGR